MLGPRRPCFSPPPSEFGDRATSPALSSSSRTTTSIPTDISDISSLDYNDDDYEVIEAPFHLTQHSDDLVSSAETTSSPYARDSTIASEIDESSFLAPAFHQDSLEVQEQNSSGRQWDSLSRGLHASTSLTTLHHLDHDPSDSMGSSLLRFPDPLHESFQGSKQVNDGKEALEEDPADETISTTPKLTHEDNDVDTTTSDLLDLIEGNDEGKSKVLTGHPFSWNKRLIVENVLRAVVGLIVVIISTGVLPSWPSTLTSSESNQMQACNQSSYSWFSNWNAPKPMTCTPAAQVQMKATKALMIKPSSNISVYSTAPSFIIRPTGRDKALKSKKRSGKRAAKPSALRIRECKSLSIYDTNAFSIKRAIYATVPVSMASFESGSTNEITKHVWTSALEKSRTATGNAKALSNIMQKEWHDWVKDMNEWYRRKSVPMAQLIKSKSYRPWWERMWTEKEGLFERTRRSWINWMQGAHRAYIVLKTVFAREYSNAKKDYDEMMKYTSKVFMKQSKQAAKAARHGKQQADRFVKDTVIPVMGQMQSEIGVVSQNLYKQMQRGAGFAAEELRMQKRAVQKKAQEMKKKRVEQATKIGLMEVQRMREKHRRLMAMVEEQQKVTAKAKKWVKKGKAGLYRKAIQSVRVKHQFEDLLQDITTSKKKLPRVKHSWKSSRKSFKKVARKIAQSQRKSSKGSI